MAVRPIPRKRRREKEMRQVKVISFFVGTLLLLAKLFLADLAVLALLVIGCLIIGDFSGLGRVAGSMALYLLLMWAIFCAILIVRSIISEKKSGNPSKVRDYPDDTEERTDKNNRNTSRKRIAKQKTLAKRAATQKQKK